MKRGNTALKRGVGLASAFALAIAGAVIAAPAANAALATDPNGIRATPAVDALNLSDPYDPAAVYSTTTTGAVPVIGVGNGRAVSDAQITLGDNATTGLAAGALFADGEDFDVVLTGPSGVTFASRPTASISGVVDLSTLSKFAGHGGTNAHPATAIAAASVTGTAPKVAAGAPTESAPGSGTDTVTVTLTNDSQVVAAIAGGTNVGYVVSLAGVRVNVADDAAAGPIIAEVDGGEATVLGYVAPFTVAFAGDANGYPANVKGAATLPDIIVTETSKNAFENGATYSLEITGTDADSTHTFTPGAPTSVVPSSKTDIGGGAGVAQATATITSSGAAADGLQSLTFKGATIADYKPGTDVKVGLTVDPAGAATNLFDDASGGAISATAEVTSVLTLTVPETTQVPRDLAGNSRYATAKNVAAELGVGNAIVIANGTDVKNGFDALSANYLAGAKGSAPIVLSDSSDNLPQATQDAIAARFKGQNGDLTIYVLGKTDSVSAGAEARAKFVAETAALSTAKVTVKRIGESDRYKTGAAVVKEAGAASLQSYNLGHGALYTAFLASGSVNADALAASALAAGAGIPVLLTSGQSLDADVAKQITDLNIQQLIVLGGTDRVAQSAIDAAVAAGVNKDAVVRIAGEGANGRYDTAAALNTLAITAVADKGLGLALAGTVYLANGTAGFPDALTIGPLAGTNTNALLTVPTNSLPDSTSKFLKDNKASFTEIQALGQSDRITDDVISAAQKAIL